MQTAGHGTEVLADLLGLLNLPAFSLHTAMNVLESLWRQCRERLCARRDSFESLRALPHLFLFPNWEDLGARRPAAIRRGGQRLQARPYPPGVGVGTASAAKFARTSPSTPVTPSWMKQAIKAPEWGRGEHYVGGGR